MCIRDRCKEEELPSPASLRQEISSEEAAAVVQESRRSAERIIAGGDDRLLVLVGPCSIHHVGASLEYAEKLKR
eukprot:692173-Hanusia_phi.AAC.1